MDVKLHGPVTSWQEIAGAVRSGADFSVYVEGAEFKEETGHGLISTVHITGESIAIRGLIQEEGRMLRKVQFFRELFASNYEVALSWGVYYLKATTSNLPCFALAASGVEVVKPEQRGDGVLQEKGFDPSKLEFSAIPVYAD